MDKNNVNLKRVASVLGGACGSDSACTHDNTECDGSVQCVCQAGFKAGTGTKANTCIKVLDGPCDTNAECSSSVPNSECATDTCKCATGYKEENNVCVASVLGGTCKTNADCSTTVDNSECATDTTVCKCASGYKEGTNVCVASVLGGACGSGSACTPDNTDYNGSVQCVCQAGFIEGTGGEANTCVKVLDGSCSDNAGCKNVPNSECSTDTCTCATGYEEKDNLCVANPGSGGTRSLPCVLLMASMAIFRFTFM